MIDDIALLKRLGDKEDNFAERKSQGIRPDEIRQTVCAFSNSLVGDAKAVLFIGIHDKTGTVDGLDNADGMQKKVREACERGCYPPITNFTCRVLTPEAKDVLAVVVGSSTEKPHFSGPAYVRRGSESVNASREVYRDLISSRNEKAGRILELRGLLVSIQGEGRRISHPIAVANHRERAVGKITHCDAHVVRFELHSGADGFPTMQLAEPLEHVLLGFDVPSGRHMLIIRSAH